MNSSIAQYDLPVTSAISTSHISTKMDPNTIQFTDDEEAVEPSPEAVFTPPAKLSWPAKLLLWLGFPVIFVTLLLILPLAGFAIPFIAVPTIWMLWRRTRLPRAEQADMETLTWTFVLSGPVGIVVVGLIQTALLYGFALILFGSKTSEYFEEFGRTTVTGLSGDDRQKRVEMARSWKYFALILFFSFPVAAFWEELLKYTAVVVVRRRRKQLLPQEYIAYILAAALGFSTTENIGYIYSSARSDGLRMFMVTVAERIMFGTLLHCLAAVLTGTRMLRRDLQGEKMRIWHVLYPAILYHGMFNTFVLGVSAFDGNVGWIHPRKPLSVTLLLLLILPLSSMLVIQARAALRRVRLGD